MATRAQVLELAILGRLRESPMHGYEIRRNLGATLGTFRTLSFGSLYPALRSLTERGLIAAEDVDLGAGPDEGSGPSTDGGRRGAARRPAGRRARIVYRLTEAGSAHLDAALNAADPAAWDDDAFDVRFTLFAETDAATRLTILEGRRVRMAERVDALRQSFARTSRRMDDYTRELARHGLEQAEREVEWLERVIDTERGTRGPFDFTDRTTSVAGAETADTAATQNKENKEQA